MCNLKYLISALAALSASMGNAAPVMTTTTTTAPVQRPATVSMSAGTLMQTVAAYTAHTADPLTMEAVNAVVDLADLAKEAVNVQGQVWSVIKKDIDSVKALTGLSEVDPRAYVSAAPYWWPVDSAPCKQSNKTNGAISHSQEYADSIVKMLGPKYGISSIQAQNILHQLPKNVREIVQEETGITYNPDALPAGTTDDPTVASNNAGEVVFVRCDGLINQDLVTALSDKGMWIKVSDATYYLGLAYFYTGDEAYAQTLAKVVNTWFLDETTGMLPHLMHAQLVPHSNEGRPEGIIEFRMMVETILDPLALVRARGSPAWGTDMQTKMNAWVSEFRSWLSSSDLGLAEGSKINNHAVWHTSLVSGLGATQGEEVSKEAQMIAAQETPVGMFAYEAARTRSMHYALFTLEAFLRISMYTGQVGSTSPTHASIADAAEWILDNASNWPFYDLESFAANALDYQRVMMLASGVLNDAHYQQAAGMGRAFFVSASDPTIPEYFPTLTYPRVAV